MCFVSAEFAQVTQNGWANVGYLFNNCRSTLPVVRNIPSYFSQGTICQQLPNCALTVRCSESFSDTFQINGIFASTVFQHLHSQFYYLQSYHFQSYNFPNCQSIHSQSYHFLTVCHHFHSQS